MIKCANCNVVVEYESDILDRIDNHNYDDFIDGGYCYEVKCDKCNHANNVWVKTETVTSVVLVDVE